ncbi:MAG: hypothetical protein OQK95_12115 [Gammaproteobacteria bacterium]|nr:hypothetical protein [Gammaproteobacteria bacterium]MCW9030571.1 hypothetical protein [Gammaproteobacteria bacterium]
MVKVANKEIQHKTSQVKVKGSVHRSRAKQPSANLDSIKKHWRYVSDENNIIIINRAESSTDKPKLTHIDLSKRFVIAPNVEYKDGELPKLVPLTTYPHLCDVLRAYTIELTNKHGNAKNTASALIVRNIYNAIRFIHFISARGKYYLEDVTRTDLDAFLESAHSGWYSILNMNEKYNTLIASAKNDINITKSITTKAGNVLTISNDAIREYFGFDVRTLPKPKKSYDLFIKQTGSNKDKTNRGFTSDKEIQISESAVESILTTVNGLRELPDDVDRLSFLPFHDVPGIAKNVSLKSEGRTENISLDDTVKILDTSLKWMYDYSPFLFDILDKLKEKSIELNKRDNLTFSYRTESLGIFFRTLWSASPLKDMLTELNVDALNTSKKHGVTSFKQLILTLQTSCFIAVAINNARRRNEIIGENKKYGLYYGCINTQKNDVLSYSKIDIYIEKTVQEYCQFWTNDLTVDAVKILEKLYLSYLPEKNSFEQIKERSIKSSRNIKLFQIKNITPDAFNNDYSPYVYSDHCKLFFKMANVNKKVLEGKAHPFRRIFSLIYHYRFKNQKLHALSHHLRHTDYEMTRVYITDPEMRSSAERIEKLYKLSFRENEVMDSINSQVQHELAIDLVSDVLNGDAAGGFTKRIKRLHNLLLNRTKAVKENKRYKQLDRKEQTEILTDSIERHNNNPNSRLHGVCWAENKHKGACRNDTTNELERHNTTPELCATCAYHQYTEEYIENLEDDYNSLLKITNDYSKPQAQRLGAKKASDNLKALIELEKQLIEKAESV